MLSIGQEIEAKVVDLNEADKKISLSIKALLADNEPEAAEVADEVETAVENEAVEETPATEE